MDSRKWECKYLWFIENYCYNTCENGYAVYSPKFTVNGLEGTTWGLALCPNGNRNEDVGKISVFLKRCEKDAGPKDFPVKFQFSFLAVDGSVLHSKSLNNSFQRDEVAGSHQFIQSNEVLFQRRAEYLPKDTLSVCCKISKGEGDVQSVEQITARSLLRIEKISFLHVVESFSTLQPNVKQTIGVQSHVVEGHVSSNLYSCSCEEIMFEIISSNAEQILRKCKLSLLDRYGNLTECGGVDNRCEVVKKSPCLKFPLSLRREVILKRKYEYLPDDKLSLLCECIFSTGFISQAVEETLHECPSTVIKWKSNHIYCKSSDTLTEYPTALEDMKVIYMNQSFADVELKTKTKSFPAHKVVLCARSPVFEVMLTNDMKEKNTACIQVDDLENETVQQLLIFFYSDGLENLQWISATQLYYAADKYQVGRLKAVCSLFLTENLSTSNASELLLLADTHNDSNLKKVAEDFILEHEEQVFGSKGWEKVIETNPLLVIKTMHLKYKRKNEEN